MYVAIVYSFLRYNTHIIAEMAILGQPEKSVVFPQQLVMV